MTETMSMPVVLVGLTALCALSATVLFAMQRRRIDRGLIEYEARLQELLDWWRERIGR